MLLLGLAAALWAFFSIADEVAEGETSALDARVILAFRTPGDATNPIGPRSIEEAVRDVTALGGTTVITVITVVAVLAFLFHRKWTHAAVLAVTVTAASLTSGWMKDIYGRSRPDLVPHGAYVYSHSFPSGHSTLSAATFLTLAMLISSLEPTRATKAMCYGLAILLLVVVGLSRIYLGVHWPSDVLGGWALGAAWAFGAWIVLWRARTRAGRGVA